VFAGLGGSLKCPIPTLNEWTEEQVAEHLDAAVQGVPADAPLVLVSHQPARDTITDLAGNGAHVGSTAVRAFIERRKPVLCLSGHIHEAQGVDNIGQTTLVNPGPFMEGRYVAIEITGNACRVDIRRAGES
jgi:Icc-related predicted phosphoesterase